MRFRHAVIAMCAIVFLVGAGMAPAAAGPPPGSVGAMVWEDVQVTINRASLFQCPATFCNQGEASPADDLQLWCRLTQTSRWYLVQNMSNGHAGWIDWSWLRARGTNELPTPPPTCLGLGIGNHVVVGTTLYQCPGTNCNRGQAASSDNIAVLCQVRDTGWRFVVNQTNSHIGYIQSIYLDWDPNVEIC